MRINYWIVAQMDHRKLLSMKYELIKGRKIKRESFFPNDKSLTNWKIWKSIRGKTSCWMKRHEKTFRVKSI